MSEQAAGRNAGRVMWVLAWGAGLLLATHFFGRWEAHQHNPNQQPQSVRGDGYIELQLNSSRNGHYRVHGQIDGQRVTFLLDTGATDVAVPEALAGQLGLSKGAPVQVNTANGRVTARRTRLTSLQLGDIVLHDVSALIAPGLTGDEVLLGMSALKQLEFSQKGGTLVLRQSTLQ